MTDFYLDQDLDLDLDLDQYYGFFKKLEGSAAYCVLAADCLEKATAFSEKVREHRIAVDSFKKANARNAACLEKVKEHEEQRILYKSSAVDLLNQAIDHSRHALAEMFFHPRYSSQPFGNLLVFLQRLQPKKAAETLKHIIVIMTNAEVKKFMEEEEIRESNRGKKSLWAIAYFRIMESVVKNALFCESIKINHKLNFLGFRVASLQYQGKMSQMRSIAYERLEMFQKRRHNLLTISAFLCFLFRKFLALPKGHHYSPEMKKLLLK